MLEVALMKTGISLKDIREMKDHEVYETSIILEELGLVEQKEIDKEVRKANLSQSRFRR